MAWEQALYDGKKKAKKDEHPDHIRCTEERLDYD